MPRPFTGPRRPVSEALEANTPNVDRFTPEVQDEIRRSYTGSQQERADQAALAPAPQEA